MVGFRDIVKFCRSLARGRSGWKTGRWGIQLNALPDTRRPEAEETTRENDDA